MGLPLDIMQHDQDLSYPAQTKQAAGDVNGILTDVMSLSFSDKIMITITQDGRLAQWVHVPLSSDNPTQTDSYLLGNISGEDSLLPSARFTPRSLLGAGTSDREMMGQLYATQIASAITTKNPEESRTLVLGLGLGKEAGVKPDRETFFKIVELVLECI